MNKHSRDTNTRDRDTNALDHDRIEESAMNGYAKIDQYNPAAIGRMAEQVELAAYESLEFGDARCAARPRLFKRPW